MLKTRAVTISTTELVGVPVGGAASYTVVLATRPTGDVTVTPASAATGTATVSGALVFTTANWATAQTVTVSGATAGSTTITHTVAGADYGTNNVTAGSVAVTVVVRPVHWWSVGEGSGSSVGDGGSSPVAGTVTGASWLAAGLVGSAAQIELLPGPVHWWSFGEGSGSNVGDGGSSPVAAVTGASWLAAGLVGSALSFDGTEDFMTVGASSLAASGGWTAALWVRRTGDNTTAALFGPSDVVSGLTAIKLEQDKTTNKVGVTRFGTADYWFEYVAPLNSWVHLTFVGDASSTKLYVNGAREGEVSQSIDLPLHYIGVLYNSATVLRLSDYLQADLDEVRIYDRALSATQIDALFATYPSLPAPPAPPPDVIPRLREWTGVVGSFSLSGTSRVVVSAGDGSDHFSGDFFSAVLDGLTDPDQAGLSAGAKDAAKLALADSLHAAAYHTASRRTLDQVAMKIRDDIKELTGLDLSVVTASGSVSSRSGDVVVDLLASSDTGISSEGYELEIADVLTISANSTSGVFYGSRTLLQMLVLAEEDWVLPRGTARDYPTQGYRLIHLDMNRKYWEMDYLADSFRQMSWMKLNAFKMHFADSNGFRLSDPGTAVWSSAVSATPTTGTGTAVSATSPAGAPTSVAVTPGNGSLAVSWNPPSGRVVRSYRVQIRAASSVEWVSADYRDSAGSGTAYKTVADRSHTFRGLSNGTAYQVRVSADTGFPGLADSRGQYVSGAKKWFYDKADIAMLESWAAENHISIMPGFEYPGHATVINDLYEVGFAHGSNPCGTAHIQGHLKPGFVLDITSARAIAQAKAIMEHFTDWFSGPYVHIGGEEVSNRLPNCGRVRTYITQTSGVSSFGDMMTVFFNDLNMTVRGLEKSMIIYNGLEKLSPSASPRLAGSIVVMDYNTRTTGYAFFGGRPGSAGTRHQFMKLRPDAGQYLTSNNQHFLYPDEARLYDRWSVEPSTTYLGTGLGIWFDYLFWSHDEYTERLLRKPRAILGDRTWNGTTTPDSVTMFYTRLDAIGDPPGFGGYQAPTRVDDGQPSHHYAFESDVNSYPPSHYKDTRDRQAIFLEDEVGGFHGTSYLNPAPSVSTTDKKVGDASWRFNNNGHGVGLGGVDILAPWTLSVWVKRTASRSDAVLLSSRSDTDQYRYIRLQRTGTQVGFDNYGTGCDFNYSTPQNTWVHLTFVATTTETTLFVNGDPQSTTCFSMPLPMSAIGTRNNSPRVYLDDLKIWDEALSAAQIELLLGPVHWWSFEEGSGSSVGDGGSSPVAGTTGASWLAAGVVGSALSFDGTDDFMTVVGASLLAASGGWTAALWVRRTGDNTTAALFGPSDVMSGLTAIKLEQNETTNKVGVTRFGTADYSFGYVAPLNSWVHLTFVGDASSTKLYVNGALEDEVSQGIDLPLHYIGVLYNSATVLRLSDYLQADLDEVRIYDRALSATQIDALFGSQRAVVVAPTSLDVVAGATATYEVVLATEPTGPVTVTPTSDTAATATVSGALTFTTTNWATAQTVTVSGHAAASATVSHTVAGGDYGVEQCPRGRRGGHRRGPRRGRRADRVERHRGRHGDLRGGPGDRADRDRDRDADQRHGRHGDGVGRVEVHDGELGDRADGDREWPRGGGPRGDGLPRRRRRRLRRQQCPRGRRDGHRRGQYWAVGGVGRRAGFRGRGRRIR